MSDGYAQDYPYFKGLVDRTAQVGFTMKEASADKGCLGASNVLATLQHGAIPYPVQVKFSAGLTRLLRHEVGVVELGCITSTR